MVKVLNGKEINIISEMFGINKEISGLEQQVNQTESAVNNISGIIKKFKKNRNKKVKRIIPGTNVIDEVEAKEIISDLVKIKEEKEIGLKGLKEQLQHQRDHFESSCIKSFNVLKKRVPRDVVQE